VRKSPQITNDQRVFLVAPILEDDIFRALKSNGDLKAPGLDGFGASFLKTTWSIVKKDVIAVVVDFFYDDKIYSAINSVSAPVHSHVLIIVKTHENREHILAILQMT
jgi:hypothetical protein